MNNLKELLGYKTLHERSTPRQKLSN